MSSAILIFVSLAEERAAPDLQGVRLVKFRGIVTRTYVLVKGEKWQVASCRLQVARGGKQITDNR